MKWSLHIQIMYNVLTLSANHAMKRLLGNQEASIQLAKRLLAHFVAFRKRYRQSVKNITYSST